MLANFAFAVGLYIVGIISAKLNYIIPFMFFGAIIWYIIALVIAPRKIDIEDAFKKNAIHKRHAFL